MREGPVSNHGHHRPRESGTAARHRGCAKTQAFIVRVESPSRFRQSENQKFWWRYRKKAIKKNHSPHSWLAHVFTQAAPVADLGRCVASGYCDFHACGALYAYPTAL